MEWMAKTPTVSEMRQRFEELEKEGMGDVKVFGLHPTNLSYGVEGASPIKQVQSRTLFGVPTIFVKLT